MASIASGAAPPASSFRTWLDAAWGVGPGAWVKASVNLALAALFEPPCAACRAPLQQPLSGAVCETCWASLRGAAPLDERFDPPHPISRLIAVDVYDGRMQDIIHALKYDRRRSISPRLGAMMRERGGAVLNGADGVVPVPLHPFREYRRGFNQAHDLAMHLGLPIAALLERNIHTHSQVDLPREQRLANVRRAFAVPRSSLPVPGIVVVVDDVSTTGATLEACAQVLKAAGVKEVRALTAARVVSVPRR
jgi:ComF family protein